MPLTNLITLVVLFLLGALLYAFRKRVLAPFQRFEARNAERRAEEARALFDRNAHYRQTLALAEEQVEQVTKIQVKDSRTGQPLDRYLFLGVQYLTLADAEASRYAEIVGKARDFYMDLDTNWLPRSRGQAEPMGPMLPAPKKRD